MKNAYRRRRWGPARAAAIWAGAATLLAALGPGVTELRQLVLAPRELLAVPGEALLVDVLLVDLAAVAAWGVLAWLLLGAGVVLGGRGAGAGGRWCRHLAQRLLPKTLRRTLEGVLGLGVAVLTATPSVAAPAPIPSLDRQPVQSIQLAPVPAVPPPVLAQVAPMVPPADLPARHAPVPDGPGPRTAPPAPAHQRVTPALPPAVDEMVVHRGDCLWDLVARSLGPQATDAAVAEAWPRWYAANRAVIGPDPEVLLPGQRLRPPATTPSP